MKNTEFTPGWMLTAVPGVYALLRSEEKRLLALLALGNPGLLSLHLEEIARKTGEQVAGTAADVPLAQAKYQAIALTDRACRVAVDAGVSRQTAAAISEACVQRCEAMEHSGEQWEIVCVSLSRFCEAIYAERLDGFSPAVRQCCVYIHQKIHGNISLDELGQVCGLSAHYVSDLFRKELGFGALQYAHQLKLQYAKCLIEHSDCGIAEIAAMLSYPSHSNFSQRFKKTYGITPHEYRAFFGQ